MAITAKVHFLAHRGEGLPRDHVHAWGAYQVGVEDTIITKYLKQIKTSFAKKKIKWYVVYRTELNTDTAEYTMNVLDHASLVEPPVKEFNLGAKGFVPPKPALKAAKGAFHFIPPPDGMMAQVNVIAGGGGGGFIQQPQPAPAGAFPVFQAAVGHPAEWGDEPDMFAPQQENQL